MKPSHRKRNPNWPRRRAFGASTIDVYEIIKELWPAPGSAVRERPWPYRLAFARRWISADEYYAVKPVLTGEYHPGISPKIYEHFPLMARLRKDTNWGVK